MAEPEEAATPGRKISRRAFISSGSLFGGFLLVQCTAGTETRPPPQQFLPTAPPEQTGAQGVYRFFTASESRTVEAVAARLIPGDESDPGAIEAGVPFYIDAKLASFESFAEPTFIQGPFVEVVEGSSFESTADDDLVVPEDQLYRYGYQSGVTPQTEYREGLQSLNDYAVSRYGSEFADLAAEEQDSILEVLDTIQQRAEGDAEGSERAEEGAATAAFGGSGAGSFFSTLRTDTIEGMFSDPLYGGNRDLIGWTLIGYPGPQRAYSPQEMLIGTRRNPQSLDGLTAMNPDRHAHEVPEALEQPRSGVRDG